MYPCWIKPHSMSVQWWQYVGLWKVFFVKLCPWLAGVSADDAMIPDPPRHFSRQNFTVKSHLAHSYYISTLFRNRTRTLWCRRVSLKFRVTCLRRISIHLLFHSWASLTENTSRICDAQRWIAALHRIGHDEKMSTTKQQHYLVNDNFPWANVHN